MVVIREFLSLLFGVRICMSEVINLELDDGGGG